MGERCNRTAEVVSSNLISSTSPADPNGGDMDEPAAPDEAEERRSRRSRRSSSGRSSSERSSSGRTRDREALRIAKKSRKQKQIAWAVVIIILLCFVFFSGHFAD